ncbi:2-oxo acid dehydrogenase subunit E2 [Cupriavidus oxalaticus]|uniref:2-oxo acid dehydrogenase subunit E2 n=1 Tax=Cupriavidus oxalaticus TaxID=96344 RepID=UPI003F73C792
MQTLTIPDIGDYSQIPVIDVLIRAGDAVSVEQPVITLESDKATMDVPSDRAGTARAGQLKPEQMQGGCFSISSLGGIGGSHFTPIINAPEVAILGVGKAAMQPTWDGSAFQPRLELPLSLSWDHRAVDGAEAGQFLAHLASLLADFRRVLL